MKKQQQIHSILDMKCFKIVQQESLSPGETVWYFTLLQMKCAMCPVVVTGKQWRGQRNAVLVCTADEATCRNKAKGRIWEVLQ